MILLDTSVWVDHLHRGDETAAVLLEQGSVVMHPFVLGELACGTLRNRDETLRTLAALPATTVSTPEEALALIESSRLMGRGLGYIDVHLIASALISGDLIWSHDKQLAAAAAQLKVNFDG
jgi:predicted nucleic acid-binding protein